MNLPMIKGAGSLAINIMASNKLTFTAHAGQTDWINKILSCPLTAEIMMRKIFEDLPILVKIQLTS